MGRPPLTPEEEPVIIQVKLRLYPGDDDDLKDFFEGIPSGYRADAVKAALRSGNIGTVEIDDLPADDVLAGALEGLLL